MQLTIQGKQLDLGAALRAHVEEKLEDINQKYFNHATYATVTFSREGHGHGLVRTHITISIGKNIMILADAVEGDPYLAFDTALAKVTSQLRRYKNRLRDHHERMERETIETIRARDAVVAAEDDERHLNGEDPVIVAEITTDIETLSVPDAVMRMDLSGQSALMFRNAGHGEINMVYRRPDGAIGWVDPAAASAMREEKPKKKAKRA